MDVMQFTQALSRISLRDELEFEVAKVLFN